LRFEPEGEFTSSSRSMIDGRWSMVDGRWSKGRVGVRCGRKKEADSRVFCSSSFRLHFYLSPLTPPNTARRITARRLRS
jgi:hypothetical protein